MKNNLTIWAVLTFLSIMLLLNLHQTSNLISEKNKFEEKRILCNKTIASELTPKGLDENYNFWNSYPIEAKLDFKESLKFLNEHFSSELGQSNKEVNTFRKLFSCYFDK